MTAVLRRDTFNPESPRGFYQGHALTTFVKIFPTPRTTDRFSPSMNRIIGKSKKNSQLREIVKNWPTPRSGKTSSEDPEVWEKRQKDGKGSTPALGLAVKMFATPKSSISEPDYVRSNHQGSGGDDLATQIGGQLNPTWVEWLMGFTLGWTDLNPSETPLSPRSPSG
jgi:hypothetical protein